jgi:AcrR family transcriptional regulator
VQTSAAAAEILPFPMLAERLPVLPDRSLDPVLDAAVACIVRHGLAKTSLSDIARELGVAPSTVYRKVGSVEHATLLVAAREGHRLLERMPEVIAGVEGPRVITVFLAESIRTTAAHPMVRRILDEESEWMGRVATRRLEASLERSAEVAAPLLAQAMDAGQVRRQDPVALAHWISRIGMTCLVAPPPGDLLEALDHLLLPVLDPGPPPAPMPGAPGTPPAAGPARPARRGGRR